MQGWSEKATVRFLSAISLTRDSSSLIWAGDMCTSRVSDFARARKAMAMVTRMVQREVRCRHRYQLYWERWRSGKMAMNNSPGSEGCKLQWRSRRKKRGAELHLGAQGEGPYYALCTTGVWVMHWNQLILAARTSCKPKYVSWFSAVAGEL